ncbi:MAG: hypothetical protein L0Y80_06340 [Ignavibacteriae bacterium]|nr:hypothetical protein [Ignavibacteriota bacterium]
MEPVIVMLIIFGSTGLILWKWIESRHRERMTMIEKGVKPAEFKGTPLRDWFRPNPLSSLKWGMLAAFVGIGIMVATYLERNLYWNDSVYPASMLIFGGLALIVFYVIASKKMNKDGE